MSSVVAEGKAEAVRLLVQAVEVLDGERSEVSGRRRSSSGIRGKGSDGRW
jgi:hypothetical protein